jgi:hypothetical protein
LRSTAEPTRRPIAYATRGGSRYPRSEKRRDTGPTRWRGAPARASKVARSRTRQIRPRAACGRGRGGPGARPDRRGSAFGYGNRGSSSACECWADTCASREWPPRGNHARARPGESAREAEAPECTGARGPERNASAPGSRVDRPLSSLGTGATFPRLARLRPAVVNFPG